MKSMKQIQSEMLAKARWDGGYPKAIACLPGIIRLAYSKEEEDEIRKDELFAICFSLILIVGFIGYVAFNIFF